MIRLQYFEVGVGLWVDSFNHIETRTSIDMLAERRGFEPRIGYEPIHAFQACDLNHSSISPGFHCCGWCCRTKPRIIAKNRWHATSPALHQRKPCCCKPAMKKPPRVQPWRPGLLRLLGMPYRVCFSDSRMVGFSSADTSWVISSPLASTLATVALGDRAKRRRPHHHPRPPHPLDLTSASLQRTQP
ncbi:MAG: hypothetical protein JWM42_2900 [Burkholderia sp.]|nr:hypothetical protein [Burkholderia sp.]